MGYQIIKNLRTEDGQIKCDMCSNNIRPRSYYGWSKPDTKENRDMVRQFLKDRVWQPQQANKYIISLGVNKYFDGTPTPWATAEEDNTETEAEPAKGFKFSDLHKVNDKFKALFGIGFKPFYDVLSPLLGQLSIDILKFDEWLHKQIGDYEDDGMSMSEAIIKHYGNQANDLVDALC